MTKKEKFLAVQWVAIKLQVNREMREEIKRGRDTEQNRAMANDSFFEARGVAIVLDSIYSNASAVLNTMRQEIELKYGIDNERIQYYADKLK